MFRTLLTANILVVVGSHPTKKRMPREGEMERVTLGTAKLGERVTAADYVRATQAGHRLCRHMAQYHQTYDVLLTPSLAAPPVKLGWLDMMLEDVDEYWRRIENFTPFSVWFNITGQPTMMLPMGFEGAGLPLSVQLVGRFGDEATLLRLSAQIEQARPWFDKRPGWIR
jgi:amidase